MVYNAEKFRLRLKGHFSYEVLVTESALYPV